MALAQRGTPYLRPPKRPTFDNVPNVTMLGLKRRMLVHEWTIHALADHDWGNRFAGDVTIILDCPLCSGYREALYDTEKSATPENH